MKSERRSNLNKSKTKKETEMLVKDKVAIVTGGGRGLGKAIALTLAQEGADVAVFYISQATVAETAKEITKIGRKTLAVGTDVSKSADVEKSVQKVLDAWGRVDILVNNAALVPKTLNANLDTWNPFLEMSDEEWAKQIGVNLSGVFYALRAAIPEMSARNWGRIVNVASIAGKTGYFFGYAYHLPRIRAQAPKLNFGVTGIPQIDPAVTDPRPPWCLTFRDKPPRVSLHPYCVGQPERGIRRCPRFDLRLATEPQMLLPAKIARATWH